jgi:hypothetical protein
MCQWLARQYDPGRELHFPEKMGHTPPGNCLTFSSALAIIIATFSGRSRQSGTRIEKEWPLAGSPRRETFAEVARSNAEEIPGVGK